MGQKDNNNKKDTIKQGRLVNLTEERFPSESWELRRARSTVRDSVKTDRFEQQRNQRLRREGKVGRRPRSVGEEGWNKDQERGPEVFHVGEAREWFVKRGAGRGRHQRDRTEERER
jgi:hypothetical protein